MNIEFGSPSRHVRSISAKAAYSKAARKKLLDYEAKLAGIRAAVKHAIEAGRMESSDKLACSQQAMDARLAAAEVRLELLQKSGEEDWEGHRERLEDAWEDLSHSINKIVARFKDAAL